jgi:hypothetical protein
VTPEIIEREYVVWRICSPLEREVFDEESYFMTKEELVTEQQQRSEYLHST